MTFNYELAKQCEVALIGSILKSPSQYEVLRDVLSENDFYDVGCRACWKAFGELRDRKLSIDQVTTADELERAGKIGDIALGGFFGRPALSAIRDEGKAGHGESYAVNVLDYSAKRQLVERFSRGAEWAFNGRKSSEIQSDMISQIAAISTPGKRAEEALQPLKEALSEAYDRTDKASRGEVKLLQTHFVDLDKMLHGVEGGDFVIIAARPGQGKTALATNIAYNIASRGERVAFFTLEMKNTQIAMRLISMVSGVDYGSQKDGKLKAEEWDDYHAAIASLENYPIYLCDVPAIQPKEIRRLLRGLIAKYGEFGAVIVDYLQLSSPDDSMSKTREQEVSKVARGMKNLSKEFDVPILACAQLSRALESRSEKRPMLADLRESGELEQAADTVIFLYRPDQYEKNSATQNVTEIIVAKQRNGETGSVELIYRAPLTKFENAVRLKFE